MTEKETNAIVSLLAAYYPSYKAPDDNAEAIFRVKALHKVLGDIDFNLCEMAVMKIVSSSQSQFAPNVGEIREAALTMGDNGGGITAGEAWMECCAAIRKFGVRDRGKAFAAMSPITARVVKSMGYRQLCTSEDDMADRAHFMRIFETMKKRETEDALVPKEIKAYALALAGRMAPALPEHTPEAVVRKSETEYAPIPEWVLKEIRKFTEAEQAAPYEPPDEDEWEQKRAEAMMKLRLSI